MSYHKESSSKRWQKSRNKRLLRSIQFLVLCLVLVMAGAYFWNIVSEETEESRSISQITQVEGDSTQRFSSAHFEFQAGDQWRHIANESSGQKFVYRKINGSIIEAVFTVYVNDTAVERSATHVLPVSTVSNSNRLIVGLVSEKCSNVAGQSIDPTVTTTRVRVASVSFDCRLRQPSNDRTNTVVVGLENFATTIKLNSGGLDEKSYSMYFDDLRSEPNFKEIEQIVQTLKLQ